MERRLERLPAALASTLLRLDARTYTACRASVDAQLTTAAVRGDRDLSVTSSASRCCVVCCDVTLHGCVGDHGIATAVFATSNSVTATSEDALHAVARLTEEALDRENTISSTQHCDGLPAACGVACSRIRRGLLPQPGDPAALLALLPAIFSINAGLSLKDIMTTVTSRQVLLMYPGFLTALMEGDSDRTVDDIRAAVGALLVRYNCTDIASHLCA